VPAVTRAWLDDRRVPLAVFVLALAVLAAVAGSRLRRPSTDTHFVAQANAWLNGHVDIRKWPPAADDPAKVETVELEDGRQVRGRRLTSLSKFRIAGGEEVPLTSVRRSVSTTFYNSFPPFPSVLMLPQVAVSGTRANDVWFTIVCAAAVPAVFVLLLRRLRAAGLSTRTPSEELWLAGLLTFGTVFFFSAVQGRVWFTAHVVGVLFAALYLLCSIEARHPVLAGVALACAGFTRTPMLFMFPIFLAEVWRMRPRDSAGAIDRGAILRKLVAFAAPVVAAGLVAAWYNYVRFGELGEFGHSYLAVRQQAQIERYGLFNLHYLGRNLAVALTLLPDLTPRPPYVSISGHGLAMWFTTPVLLYLLWPRERGPLHRILWATVALVAAFTLLYQNSGWVQFGYRFSLDYMVLLIVLLAVGARPMTKTFRVLVVLGVVINLFGALTFNREGRYYRTDNTAYTSVVPH
jgi:hypothetical protein